MLTYEYIRGLIDGEGCFSFHTSSKNKNGRRSRIPVFALAMHERDTELIVDLRNTLGLRNKVYNHKSSLSDGYNRGRKAVLFVRELDQLKDIIIPLCYKKLKGYKSKQFIIWLEKIGSDPDVSYRLKSLYRLYKWGFYDKEEKMKLFL